MVKEIENVWTFRPSLTNWSHIAGQEISILKWEGIIGKMNVYLLMVMRGFSIGALLKSYLEIWRNKILKIKS